MGEKFSVPPAEIMNVKDESFKLVLLNLKQSVDPLGFNKKKTTMILIIYCLDVKFDINFQNLKLLHFDKVVIKKLSNQIFF